MVRYNGVSSSPLILLPRHHRPLHIILFFISLRIILSEPFTFSEFLIRYGNSFTSRSPAGVCPFVRLFCSVSSSDSPDLLGLSCHCPVNMSHLPTSRSNPLFQSVQACFFFVSVISFLNTKYDNFYFS